MSEPSGPTLARTHVSVLRRDVDRLLGRARDLVGRGGRRILGITGSPGAGKSTLAAEIAAALGDLAVLVPMDGFHLAQNQLIALDRVARKGAIDTFDVGGFVHLQLRLRATDEPVVYAPAFRRDLEEPIAGAIAVPAGVPLVVVEGNYLLAEGGGWERVRPLLDEVWSRGSDQANARFIAGMRDRADVLVVGH